MNKDKIIFKIKTLFHDFDNAFDINKNNLLKILKDNVDTVYGQKYHFNNISSIDEYVNNVPLTNYGDYRNNINVDNYYTSYENYELLVSSGTVGSQKIFPLSKESISRYSSFINDYLCYLNDYNNKIFHLSIFRSKTNNYNILSSSYYHWLFNNNLIDINDYVGGKDFLFLDNINNIHYIKAWLLFSELNISCIQSIYLYEISVFFKWLEDNWKVVINDIRNKKISIELDPNIKSKLLNIVFEDDNINKIEKELSIGFNTPFVPRLYKNIKYVSGIGGSLYSVQEKALEKYIGNIPKYEFAYALSECMVSIALELNKAEYALIPSTAFYEFVSLKDEKIVDMKDLIIGEQYELVFTTFSGLYRYRSGDLIKIIRFESKTPVFEVIGKREQMIDIAGEKLNAAVATKAILNYSKKMNIEIYDFAFGVNDDVSPYGYHIFIECNDIVDSKKSDIFDEILSDISIDYKDLRSLNLLSKPIVHFVERGLIRRSFGSIYLKHDKPQVLLNVDRTKYLLNNIK